jgi:uncharacterized protein (DUF952 family)
MILHITTAAHWQSAVLAGVYHLESLDQEGFIHCSTKQQVLGPANSLYYGQEGLRLLIINPEKVQAPIIYEDCYQSGQAFPHIYGPLNLDAVNKVIDFPANTDGTFTLPPELAALL